MIYFNLLIINPLGIRDESPINPCNFSINEEKVTNHQLQKIKINIEMAPNQLD